MSFLDADYSAIECRIVNWLAGQVDAVERFRRYDLATNPEEKENLDPYRIQACSIYGLQIWEIEKFPHRLVGKHAELGCGFGMGPPKFRGTVKKQGRYDLPAGMEFKAVETWRVTHKRVKSYWYEVDKCAKRAILHPGEVITLQPENAPPISFSVRVCGGMPFLLIRLPSGRKLAYPKPRIAPSQKAEWAGDVVWFFGAIGETKQYGDVETYGGKLTENITQAVAADVMANGAHRAEAKGYPIATLIHDEALGYWQRLERFGLPDRALTVEGFVSCLTDLPPWAAGLPVAAEGSFVPFYKKD